ncbi:MAG: YkgJ family cysteine cluster protein [Sedimentisphaeraceae bacterium JB056]
MVCRRGCSDCCVNLSVFPVEFYSILDYVGREKIALEFSHERACGFLDQHGACSIYSYRPIICRTHGLPIVFHEEQNGEMVGNVSFCELNFKDIDETFIFDKFNTLNIDSLNDELFAVNLEFIKNNSELGFDLTSRIPLAAITDFA